MSVNTFHAYEDEGLAEINLNGQPGGEFVVGGVVKGLNFSGIGFVPFYADPHINDDRVRFIAQNHIGKAYYQGAGEGAVPEAPKIEDESSVSTSKVPVSSLQMKWAMIIDSPSKVHYILDNTGLNYDFRSLIRGRRAAWAGPDRLHAASDGVPGVVVPGDLQPVAGAARRRGAEPGRGGGGAVRREDLREPARATGERAHGPEGGGTAGLLGRAAGDGGARQAAVEGTAEPGRVGPVEEGGEEEGRAASAPGQAVGRAYLGSQDPPAGQTGDGKTDSAK